MVAGWPFNPKETRGLGVFVCVGDDFRGKRGVRGDRGVAGGNRSPDKRLQSPESEIERLGSDVKGCCVDGRKEFRVS
ncbi:hypothetical protein HanXRQr2_Chr12g0534671 [Helianthus annuus]|uniref:Uncharacterized protein n=1 Tax=Helianthus annuus TaxID=4232 RepID=A0A9K3HFH8_HELAN|nr:hypothetical protein HanXRQr2_Chr12g0534671 [Helianthus annuus]KAJ0862169.1 hypothetical protein HanPSC8_Chr12g0515001 [Helianthus annuus]